MPEARPRSNCDEDTKLNFEFFSICLMDNNYLYAPFLIHAQSKFCTNLYDFLFSCRVGILIFFFFLGHISSLSLKFSFCFPNYSCVLCLVLFCLSNALTTLLLLFQAYYRFLFLFVPTKRGILFSLFFQFQIKSFCQILFLLNLL